MQTEQELIEVDEPELEPSHRKPKKPISEAQLQHLANIRQKALIKKKEMKLITEKANKVKEFETMKVAKQLQKVELAKQYDEMVNNSIPKEEQKEIPKEIPKEQPKEQTKEQPKEELKKKKKVIKKIIYQEASTDSDDADEIEVVKVKKSHKQQIIPQKQEVQEPKKQENSYTNLVYESSLGRMREKLMNERCKYLVTSLMPQYN